MVPPAYCKNVDRDDLPPELNAEQLAFLQGWFRARDMDDPHDEAMLEAIEALLDWQRDSERALLRS